MEWNLDGIGCLNRMGKGTKVLKDRAKSRVEDLQAMFTELQCARMESRGGDVAVREQQVIHMLREWKNELNQPSPASSASEQQGGSLGIFSQDISRLLQLCDEEDDATSALKSHPDGRKNEPVLEMSGASLGSDISRLLQLCDDASSAPKPHPETAPVHEDFQTLQAQSFNGSASEGVTNNNNNNNNLDDVANQLDYFSFDLPQDFDPNFFSDDGLPEQIISPPPSAFLGPKCALWDCPRPAQGWSVQGCFPDYCSGFHAATAQNEGQPGMKPVLRPKGIELKDSLLFAALTAKSQGKDVGVPECEGAATAKSPWNAPELFDMLFFDGETLREWLFFDKPRRAFESGNRKQRSLPDYNGRGWHESRKQLINDYGWLKRSYYMDPQPMQSLEWHLFEYEISKSDPFALYRLELKLVDGKKTPKGKTANDANDSVADLQKQMGRLTAEFKSENNYNNKRSGKGRGRPKLKDSNGGSGSNPALPDDGLDSVNYRVEDVGGYYL